MLPSLEILALPCIDIFYETTISETRIHAPVKLLCFASLNPDLLVCSTLHKFNMPFDLCQVYQSVDLPDDKRGGVIEGIAVCSKEFYGAC